MRTDKQPLEIPMNAAEEKKGDFLRKADRTRWAVFAYNRLLIECR